MTRKQKCTAHTRSGRSCRAWAVQGSDPPRCAAHRDIQRPVTPEAGTNCEPEQVSAEPDFYPRDPTEVTIDGAIAGLADKMRRLDAIIAGYDKVQGSDWPPDSVLIRLFGLYTLASSRLSRLLRDRRALSGQAADGFTGAIAQALDELSTEWGVDL